MTQKQECLCYCIDHLQTRSLGYILNTETFNLYYERHYNPAANIYSIGVNAADEMIETFVPKPEEVNNDWERKTH